MDSKYMEQDNALLRERGIEAWSLLQDERKAKGYSYSDEKQRKDSTV